ncbi:MAG: ABC transporter permease subunit, partial [Halobacteriovoraceae bacterium]|nr:ABC transporter permease subunit [Halobacteriovoraceae bacterium]
MKFSSILSIILALYCSASLAKVRVGSKTFTESYILAEIIAQVIEDVGEVEVERALGLGATGITYQALKSGEIDIYPEYTGTISEALLKNPNLTTIKEINAGLAPDGIEISASLGFNNTYALAVRNSVAVKYGLKNISDLKNNPGIKSGFSHEFSKRSDGLGKLEEFYGLHFENVMKMDHGLAYQAIENGKVDLMEVYSTDAKIKKFDLTLLRDNLNFFPAYHGVLFFRKEFKQKYPRTWKALKKLLVGRIDNSGMIRLNAEVELEKKTFAEAAGIFLNKKVELKGSTVPFEKIKKLSLVHLRLVFVALLVSILFGIPLGVLSSKSKALAFIFLSASSLVQTIPSLALLCFLIPILGIGELPSYVALFIYGLLPIVRNTYTGIQNIDPSLIETGKIMGMNAWERLWHIQVPLSSPLIMAGIKTSAVINVGTATVAAF